MTHQVIIMTKSFFFCYNFDDFFGKIITLNYDKKIQIVRLKSQNNDIKSRNFVIIMK